MINNYFHSLNATKGHTQHIGRSVHEIFQNLVRMGQMYTLELYDDDFYKMELIHNVLSYVYGGDYPIYEILLKVASLIIISGLMKISTLIKRLTQIRSLIL